MSTSNPSLRDVLKFLTSLEQAVDVRIHEVDVANTRLRNNKRILTEAINYVEEDPSDNVDLSQKIEGLVVPSHRDHTSTMPPAPVEDTAFSLPSKLDEILNLAKVIREPHAKTINNKDSKVSFDQTSVSSVSSKQSVKTSSSSNTGKSVAEKRNLAAGKYSVMTKPPTNTNKTSTDTPSSSSNKLSSAGKTSSSSQSTATGKERSTPRPQPLYQALIQESENRTESKLDTAINNSRPTLPSPRHQTEQQLFLLNKQRILSMLKPGFMFTPKLLQAQTLVLTTTNCILPIPNSLLFATFESMQKLYLSFDKDAFETLSSESKVQYLERIDGEIQRLMSGISRSPVSRINTLPISHFTAEQFCELFQFWYRGKLLTNFVMSMIKEVRRHNRPIDSTKISEFEQSLQMLVKSSIEFPRPEPNEIDENYKVGGKSAWLRHSQKSIEGHFKQLSTLAKFCFDYYCSEAIFPQLHKALQKCMQHQQSHHHPRTPTKSSVNSSQQWREALKSYQLLYTLLVGGGKDHASCLFMEK